VTIDGSGSVAVVERPVGGTGALVRFEAALIGDRDLAMLRGGAGAIGDAQSPIILGSSLVGRVLEVDDEPPASGLEAGARVVATPVKSCGTCEGCVTGNEPRCTHALHYGEDIDGFWREVNRIPISALSPIDSAVDLTTACHAGELALALRMAELAQVDGKRVAVFGSGRLAALAVEACLTAGAASADVVDTDRDEGGWESPEAAGARWSLSGFSEHFGAEFDGRPDVIVNVSSAPGVVDQAIQLVGIGGNVATSAAPSEITQQITDYTPRMQRRDVRLIGVSAPNQENLRRSIELLEQGRITPPRAITCSIPLGPLAAGALGRIAGDQPAFGNVFLTAA
jgi:D-arabinose 1-dehydrogenase-like Zn-dependent alcohol dehydrogenase